jgi:Cft2 family RNA processing exonuclease
MFIKSKEVLMYCNELMLHDDYQSFAENYLGIDYEDYVEMLSEIELPDDEFVLENGLSF